MSPLRHNVRNCINLITSNVICVQDDEEICGSYHRHNNKTIVFQKYILVCFSISDQFMKPQEPILKQPIAMVPNVKMLVQIRLLVESTRPSF